MAKKKTTKIKQKIFVLYHKNCSSGDGFGGAYAAWKKFGSRAEYIGINHGDDIPSGIHGAEVYLIDITYPKANMKRLIAVAQKVIALDHHESSEHDTKMAQVYVYDTKRSGSTIAWNYFFPHKKTPMLLRYLEDADNWFFRMPRTKEMLASLNAYDRDFLVWDRLAKEWEVSRSRNTHKDRGSAILRYQNQVIKKTLDDAYEVTLLGHRIFTVNSAVLVSVIANHLAQRSQAKFAIVWSRGKNIIKFSLRSYGVRDVSKIAAHFGGGGHKHSSAFILPANKPFPWKEIKK
jgi:nanoRNase/pAp phosphatase (c-di-AMP/oligoRNAs hydrolase)